MNEYPGLQSKRVLITGATSGLGFSMAKALAASGGKIMITGREQKRVDLAVDRLRSLPGELLGVAMDVRDEESIKRALEQMVQQCAGIDVLVNNAGLGMRTVNARFLIQPLPFWEVPAGKFRDVIDTNLTGYFLVAKHAVPHLLKQGGGKIINISVNHETMRRKGFIPYGPSRAASESLSYIMAEDLGPSGITVNTLLPGGATDTGMIPDEFPSAMRSQLLSPEVMAEPILFLCSEASNGVHNERIVAKDFSQWIAARSNR
jgi:NAD(P)-dependent dehydrogenase (short-subunit alcohol dehydrogenase family)